MAAIRSAVTGDPVASDLIACLALGVVYGAIGAYLSRRLVDSARRHATLALT